MISDEDLKGIINSDVRHSALLVELAKELLAHRKAREGWKLVQVEPTQEMVLAGKGGCVTVDMAREVYEDMLAAAP